MPAVSGAEWRATETNLRSRFESGPVVIRPELLEILRCPETHQRLSLAPAELIAKLNAKARAGQLQNRLGKVVTESIEGGLVREDQRVLYPIRGELPILLISEALPAQ